jgi:hypothetical protein
MRERRADQTLPIDELLKQDLNALECFFVQMGTRATEE